MSNDTFDEDMPRWPEAVIPQSSARDWIRGALPGMPVISGPDTIARSKEWSVTASFSARWRDGREQFLFFKAIWGGMFPAAPWVYTLVRRVARQSAPALAAWTPRPDGAWMLFKAGDGRPLASESLPELMELARTLARIQVAVAALPATAVAGLPVVRVADLPAMFDTLVADIRDRQLAFWLDVAPELAEQFCLPADLLEQLARFRPFITRWSEQLAAGGWPLSVDHVDVQSENAWLSDGGVVLLDWDEANLSCPFFSVDLLLDDAFECGGSAAVEAVLSAYRDTLPWGTPELRAEAIRLALCLSPIKHAFEAQQLAARTGWPEGSPHITAWALGRALPRWRAATGDTLLR